MVRSGRGPCLRTRARAPSARATHNLFLKTYVNPRASAARASCASSLPLNLTVSRTSLVRNNERYLAFYAAVLKRFSRCPICIPIFYFFTFRILTKALTEFAIRSLLTKVHTEKKTQSKKTRRCSICNMIPYRTPSSFFLIGVFFSGCYFVCKLLVPTYLPFFHVCFSNIKFVKWY